MLPKVHAALRGGVEVPPHDDGAEAWLALTLFYDDTARPGALWKLEDMFSTADYIKDAIPDWPEVAGAFVRLRRRGWLAEDGDRWGLTRKGRDAIEEIVTLKMVGESLVQLESWLAAHGPP